jgi:hypothetical protein
VSVCVCSSFSRRGQSQRDVEGVLVIGQRGSGKSAFIENVLQANGADTPLWKFIYESEWSGDIEDKPKELRKADVVILVYNPLERSTFGHISTLLRYANTAKRNPKVYLVGTHKDAKRGRVIDDDEALRAADTYNTPLLLVDCMSASDCRNTFEKIFKKKLDAVRSRLDSSEESGSRSSSKTSERRIPRSGSTFEARAKDKSIVENNLTK